jgi:hypothetical protein
MKLHAKKILGTLNELPPNKLDEVLDFAEYLRAKEGKQAKTDKKTRINLPTFHLGKIENRAFNRDHLYGEYLDHKFD